MVLFLLQLLFLPVEVDGAAIETVWVLDGPDLFPDEPVSGIKPQGTFEQGQGRVRLLSGQRHRGGFESKLGFRCGEASSFGGLGWGVDRACPEPAGDLLPVRFLVYVGSSGTASESLLFVNQKG